MEEKKGSRTIKKIMGKLANQRGFSLMELMIVMVILGLLASLVGPAMFKKLGTAKQNAARTQIGMLMASLDAYRLDVGHYPSQADGLESLVVNPGEEKWDGPYLKKGIPADPWDNSYYYVNPGEHGEIDIYSLGADNREGGEKEDADVVSWE